MKILSGQRGLIFIIYTILPNYQIKMAIIIALILIAICSIDDCYSGMCQYNFDVMACYGSYVNPLNCPRKTLIINSPLSVINLAKCRSTNVLTILFNKQCPLTIRAARPISTIPAICLDRVSPPEYRSSASICSQYE